MKNKTLNFPLQYNPIYKELNMDMMSIDTNTAYKKSEKTNKQIDKKK